MPPRVYFGLLLLAGVYRSRGEATRSLWDEQTGRHIFRATISCKTFETIGRILRFDDRLSRPRRRGADKMPAVTLTLTPMNCSFMMFCYIVL